jgi:hypothetical protein
VKVFIRLDGLYGGQKIQIVGLCFGHALAEGKGLLGQGRGGRKAKQAKKHGIGSIHDAPL